MRVSGSSGSPWLSHLAGMSALWHDADYLPDKRIDVPSVHKWLDDQPLPSEQHQLPKGHSAFQKLDEVYEVAAAQMDRGIDAQAFLYGRKVPAPGEVSDPALRAPPDDPTRTFHARQAMVNEGDRRLDVRAVEAERAVDRADEQRNEAANQPTATSNAAAASNQGDMQRAVRALKMAEGLGVTLAASAAGQGLDPVSSSALAEAASVVKAVGAAKTAVGMTSSIQETPETSRAEHLRRGLARRRHELDMGEPEPSES